MTLPTCPSIVRRSVSTLTVCPRDNPRPPTQMSRYPSHSDETCAKRGVGAARTCEPTNNTCHVGGRNTFSPLFRCTRAKEGRDRIAMQSDEINKLLNLRAVWRHAKRAKC